MRTWLSGPEEAHPVGSRVDIVMKMNVQRTSFVVRRYEVTAWIASPAFLHHFERLQCGSLLPRMIMTKASVELAALMRASAELSGAQGGTDEVENLLAWPVWCLGCVSNGWVC